MYSKLLHKLTYRFHRLGFYFCSVKYGYEDNCLNQNKVKCFIKILIDKFKIFNYKYGYYEYLEIPIWKQNKISDIISEIKESKDVEKQENLFKKLVDLLEEDD